MKCNKIGLFYNKHNEQTASIVSYLLNDSRVVDCLEKPNEDVDAVLMFGGDGLALRCFHAFYGKRVMFYGVNYGNVGFFMNPKPLVHLSVDEYIEKISVAHPHKLQHLACKISSSKRASFTILAVNDVSLSRASPSAAKLRIEVDGNVRIPELVGDGIIVSTPAGSTGYNCSLGGPVLPIKSNFLAMTPIAPRKPRGWGGAILANSAKIKISTLESSEHCKLAVDGIDYYDVSSAEVEMDLLQPSVILLDSPSALEEKSMRLMFFS